MMEETSKIPYLKLTYLSSMENHFTTILITSLDIDEENIPIRSIMRITAIEPIAAINWLSVRADMKSPIAMSAIATQVTPMKLEIISAAFIVIRV